VLPRSNKIWSNKIWNIKTRNNKCWIHIIFLLIFLYLISFLSTSPALAENIFIKFYREQISVVDGNRCSMYPSCSSYASEALEKHGLITGWVMVCDRLVRCGRDEVKFSMKTVVNNQEYIYDSVAGNDFWWFKKEKKE